METLKELVSIGSYDTSDNTKIIDYLTKKFNAAKEIIKIKEPNLNKYSLIIGLNSKVKDCDCILLSGHIDTVNLEKKNLQPTIVKNKLYGLGSIDMKCFFASIIDNLQFLKSMDIPIIVAITCDEETTLNSIGRVVKKLKERNVRPALTILGEPTNLDICTEAKCCNAYKIRIAGKSCHSSKPQNGVNAIYIASKIASFIETLSQKFENTTLSVGKISGGVADNIVPSSCEMAFDLRSVRFKELALRQIENYIEKLEEQYACKISIENILEIPGFYQERTFLIKEFEEKLKLKTAQFIGGCEAGYLKELGGDVIVFGAGKLSLAHTPNEYLEINKYEKYNKLFLQMLKMAQNK